MKYNLLLIIILAVIARDCQGQACSSANDCLANEVCVSGYCGTCANNSQCSAQNSLRTLCLNQSSGYFDCYQCNSNSDCSVGSVCVLSGNYMYDQLCGQSCSSPTDACTSTSQCIWVPEGYPSQFYCLTCENDVDCINWSSNHSSRCSNGTCAPAFLSCGGDSNCTSPSSPQCSNYVCSPCNASNHCTHLTSTHICNTSSGVCVQCLADSDCLSTTAAQCSGSNTCVACTNSTQCAHLTSTPICNSTSGGTCVQCLADSDCPSATAAQCSGSNTCIPCTNLTQCAHLISTPLCSSSSGGTCVQCLTDTDCPSITAAQCSTSNFCIGCTDSSHCTHLTSTPACNIGNGVCTQCVADSDCSSPSAAQCSGINACSPCTASSRCTHLTWTPQCNTSTGVCVQCLTDSDCSSTTAAHCSANNTCVACTVSTQCAHLTSTPVCTSSSGGTCVQCLADSDCTLAATAHCSESNICTACTDSSQCTHLTSTPVCTTSSGACVQCLADSDCSSAVATHCSTNNNTCVACYRYQNSCYSTCPDGTFTNSTNYTCQQILTCESAADCTADKTHPECNGTSCVACSSDADCQQWYNQSDMTCKVTSGACTAISSLAQGVVAVSSAVASSAVIAVGGTVAISAFTSGGGGGASQGFMTLRITKLATLIRYININFPDQVEDMFEAFSSSHLIKNLLVSIFGAQQYNQTTINLPTRFVKFKDSGLFLKNAGSILLISVFVVLGIAIIRALFYSAQKKRNVVWTKRFRSIQIILEWNYILGFIMGTYPDLILGIGLQIYNLQFSNRTPLTIISLAVCGFIAPLALLFPLICTLLMQAEQKDRNEHKYHSIIRYMSLVSGFKENNNDTKTYQVLGLLRVQAMVFPLIFWQSNPQAQILFMIVSSLMVDGFQILKVPYKNKFTSFVILTNESLLLVTMVGVFLHIVFNSSGLEGSNPNLENGVGWTIIVGLLSLMSFNLIISALELLKLTWLGLKSIIFRSKAPNPEPSSNLSNISVQQIPSTLSPNTSLDLLQRSTMLVDNNKRIRLRPKKSAQNRITVQE